jgi:predicted transcriptional regulator YdeE
MYFENVELDEFLVIGISVRTMNQNGQSQKDIGELWGKFMGENIAAKIPDKTSNNIYCIYTDYESDFTGAYTTVLGCRVGSIINIPEGLIAKKILASEYRVYRSTGKLPYSVLHTWKAIWDSDVKRKYLADFDVYPPDVFSSENPVATYLSV